MVFQFVCKRRGIVVCALYRYSRGSWFESCPRLLVPASKTAVWRSHLGYNSKPPSVFGLLKTFQLGYLDPVLLCSNTFSVTFLLNVNLFLQYLTYVQHNLTTIYMRITNLFLLELSALVVCILYYIYFNRKKKTFVSIILC